MLLNIVIIKAALKINNQSTVIQSYGKYLPAVEELITQVRARQHQYNNHLSAINSLTVSCPDYDTLKAELNKNIEYMSIASKGSEPFFLLEFNLKLLSGFLFHKYVVALSKGVTISFDIKNYVIHTKVPEYKLVEVIGILIDNAVEACTSKDVLPSDNGLPANSTTAICNEPAENSAATFCNEPMTHNIATSCNEPVTHNTATSCNEPVTHNTATSCNEPISNSSSGTADIVWIEIDCLDNQFIFTAKNPGPIVNPGLSDRMFRRGYTTKANSDNQHGYGLSNLKNILDRYHGTIELGNEVISDRLYIYFKIVV